MEASDLAKGREIIDRYIPAGDREFYGELAKNWTPEDDKRIDTSGLVGFQTFEEEWNKRWEEKTKEAEEKIKKMDEEFPLQERILAIEQMKAKERQQKEFQELEEYEKRNNPPQITFSLSDLLTKNFPPVQWVVDRLIPDRGLIAISGLPGSYKSWITEHLALAAATGTPLFDRFATQQKKVLIIDKENQLSLVQKRFKLLGGLEGLEVSFLETEFFIEDEQLVSQICDLIHKEGFGLLIFDSLIRIYKGKDENSSNHMSEVFRQLRRFQDAGATVVFVHHHRKQGIFSKNTLAEAMRGSSDILASVDSHLAIDVIEGYIRVSQPKLRQDVPLKPFKLRLESSDDRAEFIFHGEVEEDKEKMEEAKSDILQALDEGESTRTGLIDRFKGIYGSKTIDAVLKSFNPEEVTVRVAERGKRYYKLAGTKQEGGLFQSD